LLALQKEFLMIQAQVRDLVRVHYTGRLADGSIFDTSMEREPLESTLGEGELVPGFEQAVLGMAAGESIVRGQARPVHGTRTAPGGTTDVRLPPIIEQKP
jgi:hypothetical protein